MNIFAVIAKSAVTHVLFAFVVMGGWAVFANRAHPWPEPLFAGLVQGTISAILTLMLKTSIDWMTARFKGVGAAIYPPLIACSVSLTVLIVAHSLAATPELFTTIAFPFSVAFTYAVVYSFSLWRARR